MKTIIKNACGLDVHQASITACIHSEQQEQIKEFGTTTQELEALKNWLHQHEITHVAMESTGVYWKPVFNIIGEDFEILLANARHIKHVPGRKTDIKDAEWICKLLRTGLLQGSFIPSQDICQLRNLTRYQKQLKRQEQSEKRRIHKILQEANIKITTVLSDIFGVTGFKILEDLSKGITDAKKLSEHLEKNHRLSKKKAQAIEALEGRFTKNHQFMLKIMLGNLSHIENQIITIEKKITELMQAYKKEHELLQTIPGISTKGANIIISEIGADMNVFPTANHLASWAGLCPTNNESAGKKKAQK